jgi:hypothetical protein
MPETATPAYITSLIRHFGWEWTETNGWVSASQLRCAPPLGHLFAYLLASLVLSGL